MLMDILKLQQRLMAILEVPLDTIEDPLDRNIIGAILGLSSEVGELSQTVNVESRKWADASPETIRRELGKESIDVLFYLIELFILLGFDANDITTLYREKHAINCVRVVKSVSEWQRAELLMQVKAAGWINSVEEPYQLAFLTLLQYGQIGYSLYDDAKLLGVENYFTIDEAYDDDDE